MTEEMNAIEHLLEIESESNLLVKEAHQKADAKISEARAQAEAEFKRIYGDFSKNLEQEEISEREKIEKQQDSIFNEYVESLNDTPKDKKSFNALLKKLLFV